MSFECPEKCPRNLMLKSWLIVMCMLSLFTITVFCLWKVGLIVYGLVFEKYFSAETIFSLFFLVPCVFVAFIFLEKPIYAWLLIFGQICEAEVQSIDDVPVHWWEIDNGISGRDYKIIYSFLDTNGKKRVFSRKTSRLSSGGNALLAHPGTVTVLFCRKMPQLNVIYRLSGLTVKSGIDWRREYTNKTSISAHLNAGGTEKKVTIILLIFIGIVFTFMVWGVVWAAFF